ncbi:transcriptional regulator [Streptomyces sp. NPDC057702]|uniref:transcriptional regulator n=1 Tax=unclassified Streptomyces TaxID=2593676 RepID=UPI00368C6BD8
MSVPLYQAKAEFFRMSGRPVRIRELVRDEPLPVRASLTAIEGGPSTLSRQLAVSPRAPIGTSRHDGCTGAYALAGGDGTDLTRAARRVPSEPLAGRDEPLAESREAGSTKATAR